MRLNLNLSEESYKELVTLSDTCGMSISATVREALTLLHRCIKAKQSKREIYMLVSPNYERVTLTNEEHILNAPNLESVNFRFQK